MPKKEKKPQTAKKTVQKRPYKRHTQETKKQAIALLDSGMPVKDICETTGINKATLYRWNKARKDNISDTTDVIANIDKQIEYLSRQETPTTATAHKISMLAGARDKLLKSTRRKKRKRKPKVDLGGHENTQAIRKKIPKALGLFNYQEQFFTCDAQFRIVLKARQIGFSYVAGAEALVGALEGRDQLFLSASEEQAIILTRYVQKHAETLGIKLDGGDKEIKVPGGGVIKAMAHNWRTVQGFTGDIWMDEFAWYANPKRIWAAFVPSIGTIKGRLTIMSTPFEAHGQFYELFNNKNKYFMFERFRIDIHKAMADGLDFDLEVMQALFDDDTWALMYECEFADDESAFYPIGLIKSCVDPKHRLYIPSASAALYAGFDVGRIKDLSVLASLDSTENRLKLAVMDILKKATFDDQETAIKNYMNLYRRSRIRMDRTGIGMALSERICKKYRVRAQGIHFTAINKEAMAINFKKLLEERKIVLPHDPVLIADIHSIKRRIGQKSFIYDSDRNEYGHADRFWALALAASHKDIETVKGKRGGEGKAWII